MILEARKYNFRKKGQALLIVIVISTLALLILLSMADRISLTRVNVQRSAEFDKSVAAAENKLNDLIKIIDAKDSNTAQCLGVIGPNDLEYKEINCPQLFNSFENTKIYGRISPNSFVTVNASLPLTLVLGTSLTSGLPTTGIVARCEGSNTARFMITRVYYDPVAVGLFVDKGIYTCVTGTVIPTCQGNVNLYDTRSGVSVRVGGNGAPIVTRSNTILVRARLLDETASNTKLDMKVYGNSPSCSVQARTSKYEFLVAGLGGVDLATGARTGGLGSDALFSFEKPNDNSSPWSSSLFDYALFTEDP